MESGEKTRTLWHGTTLSAAEKIKREGLRWDVPKRLHTRMKRWYGVLDQPDAGDHFVRAAPDKQLAAWYARFRTRYEQLPPGEYEDFLVKYGRVKRVFDLIKNHSEPMFEDGDVPAIVKLEVPEEFMRKHASLDDLESREAWKFDVPIPPQYVKSVVRVTETR